MNKSFLRRRCCGGWSAAAGRRNLRSLLCLLSLGTRMALKSARRRKLAQLVSDHVLSDIDRNVTFAVVHSERQPNHVGRNRRTTRPRLAYFWSLPALANPFNSFHSCL